MGQVTRELRDHHRELMRKLTEQVTPIVEGSPEAEPRKLAAFLKRELLPHAVGEERYLYPALDPVIKAHTRPTTTMSIDHEFIEGYIDWIQETAEELETAEDEERPPLERLLSQLCLQLGALMQVHIAKEERVYIPLMEEYLTAEEQQRIVDRMHRTDVELPAEVDREPMYAHPHPVEVG
jgi:iron-sulfur cluster repair protein YtfE (RIC family)